MHDGPGPARRDPADDKDQRAILPGIIFLQDQSRTGGGTEKRSPSRCLGSGDRLPDHSRFIFRRWVQRLPITKPNMKARVMA